MKKKIITICLAALILTSAFIPLAYCEIGSNQIVSQIKNGNSYELVLSDQFENHVHCGVLSVAVAMRFRLKKSDILVLIPCPEMYGKGFFLKGSNYKIKLSTDSSFLVGRTIINKYEQLRLPTYYAIKVEKM